MLAVKIIIVSNGILRPSVDNYPLKVPENSQLLTIAEETELEIEPELTLTLIGETPAQAAYSIQYKETNILIPRCGLCAS
jgi:hypothetical protein